MITYIFRNLNEIADFLDEQAKEIERQAEYVMRVQRHRELTLEAAIFANIAMILRDSRLTGQPTGQKVDSTLVDPRFSGGDHGV